MPDLLPDVDVQNVSHLAYWNALEHDASYLDPADLLSYDGVRDFTAYDNGITGLLDRDPRLKWRAKTDGWMVVFYDETVGDPVEDHTFVRGFEDGGVDIVQNVLSVELNGLREEAENAAQMDFSHEDVGIMDYRDNDYERYETLAYTPPGPGRWAYRYRQAPEKLYLTGRSEMNVNGESITPIEWNAFTLVSEQSGEGTSANHVEAVAEGWVEGDGEFHELTGGNPSYEDSDVRAGVFAIYEE